MWMPTLNKKMINHKTSSRILLIKQIRILLLQTTTTSQFTKDTHKPKRQIMPKVK